MFEIGAIRYCLPDKQKVKLVALPAKKRNIIKSFIENGAKADSFGPLKGEQVNNTLTSIGKVIGKKIKPVEMGQYEFLHAHGAVQIVDSFGKEVIGYIEHAKHPLKELFRKI